MSAIDDVRGVPGGAELATLAATLVGDPGAVGRVVGVWQAAADTGRGQTAAVRSAVGDLDAAWQGASADAFVTYMDRAGKIGDTLQSVLSQCATHLATAAEALRTAESQANAICQNYAAAVRDFQARNPQATQDQIRQGVQGLAGDARKQLAEQRTTANNALGTAAAGIRGLLGGLGRSTENWPEPDTEPFAPGPGRALDWTPSRQQNSTTLAEASGTNGTSGTRGQSPSLPGFGGYGPSGPPPAGGGPAPQGQVADWITQAVNVLKAQGYPVEKMNANDIWTIIRHESDGNPNAINNWDSNAAKGTPSKGLMQTIDPTFNRWKLPGHENIYDPVDNIIAGVRYAIDRYGSVSNVPGVVGTKTGGGYRGY
ncbi:transglycosylase SLT domain-containing protein [Nonomuraea aurantiaca]|uniref:transglycosylase SLT domain-containing protein n=1 Tax=Nonomuraea aurantiaca TaxID=2878562 RepID=UPI001CD97DAC|nr:transglycosylase SLT domain-containing protein [Nonomuraea aurantiaca]MCA2221010.1 transglycosylase SLT domain-containing protein [Nonomuraea aurantiaca]